MNVIIVMSGGVGARFGADVPKQYNLIAGRPVIDYVLDAVDAAKKKDRVVIVMDQQWALYSSKIADGKYDMACNGATRLESLYNGMTLVKEKYPCSKIVVVDAAAPMLEPDIIDEYFDRLDNYDAVITAQKITGGFTDIEDGLLDREKYIITQSPEGFRFDLLWNSFNINFLYQEIAGMLPKGSKRYYNYSFRYNLKITYNYELSYAEVMLKNQGKVDLSSKKPFFDKRLLLTNGIKSFLLRKEPEKTQRWIDAVYSDIPVLFKRWEIISFLPNQISRFGLVLQATSQKHGQMILKFIPDFVGRFERELEAMRVLPSSYMCHLIDAEENCNCMLLERISPARFGSFEEKKKFTDLFKHVIEDAVLKTEKYQLKYIPYYYNELMDKLAHAETMPYCRELIEPELVYAVDLYQKVFADRENYILHGDLHELNILDNGKRFYGIDPNGMLGPIELECVRFIRNDVRNHPSVEFEHRFELLLSSFSQFVNIHRLVDIFIIDMAFCSFNSVFENENPKETYDDLELIRVAKKWKANHPEQSISHE